MDHHADISNQTLNMKIRKNNNPKKNYIKVYAVSRGSWWKARVDILGICEGYLCNMLVWLGIKEMR